MYWDLNTKADIAKKQEQGKQHEFPIIIMMANNGGEFPIDKLVLSIYLYSFAPQIKLYERHLAILFRLEN